MTIIAAYAAPCDVLCSMMIPASDHGSSPRCMSAVFARDPAGTRLPAARSGISPVSDVIRTVMLPFPASGWRTK